MVIYMEFFKNSRFAKLFECIMFAFAGLASLILCFIDINIMCYTLAGICFLVGIFYIYGYFSLLNENFQELLSRGIVLLLLALIIILFTEQFLGIFNLIIAIFLIYNAIQHFTFALDLKAINEHHYKIDFVFSILLFLLGISFIVLDSFEAFDYRIIIMVGSSSFILFGITKLILLTKVHPSYNKKTK